MSPVEKATARLARGLSDAAVGRQDPAVGDHQLQLMHSLQMLTGRLGEASLKVLVGETVSVLEQHYIEAALAHTDGNRSAAAKMLGLSRQSLYVKLSRYGIGVD
jgi:DNA-binding NtrC family response regulator